MSNRIVCPVCGNNDQIQKVSAIVMAGTSSYEASGPTAGPVFVGGKMGFARGVAKVSGTTQTQLAQMLVPPEAPKKPAISWKTWALAAFCLFMSWTLAPTSLDAWSVVFFIAAWVILFLKARQTRQDKKTFPARKLAWEAAIIRWNRLYYCRRNDAVFDPETDLNCSPNGMYQLLYW